MNIDDANDDDGQVTQVENLKRGGMSNETVFK